MKPLVKEMLEGSFWDKKTSDKKMHDILSNICFELIEPYSVFVYRTQFKVLELQKLTNVVFNKIDKAVVLANKCNSLEEFRSVILCPVEFVQELMGEVISRMPCLDAPEGECALLLELDSSMEPLYDRYYNKQKRKLKRRKNVRTKSKRSKSVEKSNTDSGRKG